MKNLTLLIFLVVTVLQAKEKELVAKIVFENNTNQELISGRFFVADLNKIIEVNSENDFEITLPKKGKYQFSFYTENFDSYTYYPAKINSSNNIIIIRLQEKGKDFNYSVRRLESLEKKSELFPSNFEVKKTEEYGMNFIIHSIDSKPFNNHNFQKKFGIGLKFQNCLLDPLSYKKAVEHNKYIVEFLNEKFGDKWKKDLPIKPFGVQ